MTSEEINSVLAEVDGWEKLGRYFWSDEYEDLLKLHGPGVIVPHFNGRRMGYYPPTQTWAKPMNYYFDLNAMHSVEKKLTEIQRKAYWTQISLYTAGVGMYPGEATAKQRATAMVTILGKLKQNDNNQETTEAAT